jgi:hypothetical protein
MGLVKKWEQPASKHASRSRAPTRPVSATTRMPAVSGWDVM